MLGIEPNAIRRSVGAEVARKALGRAVVMKARHCASRLILLVVVWCWLTSPAAADHTFFSMPIDCEIGASCYIQNYVDADPSSGAQDYTCGSLTYDTHRGTDFRIRGLKAMTEGVLVVASAPGVVTGMRDGMQDINVRNVTDPRRLRHIKREAALGNVVAIQHDHGVVAYYGHMRKGSVIVRNGQRVARGEALGFVGLSGDTEFPHVHFEVRRTGKVVDPFTGLDGAAGCRTASGTPLWHPEVIARMEYVSTALHAAGFSTNMPDAQSIEAGSYDGITIDRDAPALLFWSMVYGARGDDTEFLQLIAPDGSVLAEHQKKIERNKAQIWRAVGKRRRAGSWPTGAYTGRYILTRGPKGSEKTVVEVERVVQIR